LRKTKIVQRVIALYFSINFFVTISIVVRLIWAKLQLKLLRVKLEIIGKPDEDAKMLILNHQSIADILGIYLIFLK